MFKRKIKFYEVLTETETIDSTVGIMPINEENVESIIKLMKTEDIGDDFKIIVNREGIVFDDIYQYSPITETFNKRGVHEQEREECEEVELKTDLKYRSKFIVVPTTKTIFVWEE